MKECVLEAREPLCSKWLLGMVERRKGGKKEYVNKGPFPLREIENGIEAKRDKDLRSNCFSVPEALESSGYSMIWQVI